MMNLVFCADRKMLAALHVAAYSILSEISESARRISIFVFSADIDGKDLLLLRETLDRTFRDYEIEICPLDPARFAEFPELQASFATYFRLVVPEVLEVDRFLYVDADTLCRIDLMPLYKTDLSGCPIGLVPEAPIHQSPDPEVAELLGERARGSYFNAGVMLVDAEAWRAEDLTERCLDFIRHHLPKYHDQSALNFVLHGNIRPLPARYNCRTNARENWRFLTPPNSGTGRLLHFVDFPKPWSPGGRAIHAFGRLWAAESGKCACLPSKDGDSEATLCALVRYHRKYVKALKDKVLFGLLSAGWISRVKGVDPS